MSYIHKESFRIRTSEIDHHKKIHAHCLIQLMQEASMQHTLGMKVSVWDLENQNVTWVLLKMEVSFFQYPKLGEEIEVQTYPSGLDGFFTYRDYFVYDRNGDICATSTSMWALMDTESRKMVRIPESFSNLVYQSEEQLPKPNFKRIQSDVSSYQSELKINYLHLDWNGHVNNVQVLKIILETIDVENWYNKTVKTVKIQFKTEAILDQRVSIRHQVISENQLFHSIVNLETNTEIAFAITDWNNAG